MTKIHDRPTILVGNSSKASGLCTNGSRKSLLWTERWTEAVADITSARSVDEATAQAWFERLRELGLERPQNR